MRQWMEGDFDKLLGAVHLGGKIRSRSRSDMAVHAGHMGVRRDFVGRELRMHHVAGLAAKLGRIHIRRPAIGSDGNNQQVDDGGHQDDVQAVAKDAIVQIYPGKFDRNLPGLLELSAAEKDADRNQQQACHEQSGKEQEEDNAEVGICVGPAYNLHQPVADHGHAGGAGDGAACKTDGVIAEE